MYVCDVDEAALSGMLAENPGAHGIVADVSDVAAVERVFDDVARKNGGVDILVNNAGIAGPTAGIADVTPEDLRKNSRDRCRRNVSLRPPLCAMDERNREGQHY